MRLLIKFILVMAIAFCASGRAELQTTLSMTAPTLTPGGSGSFTATQVTGPAASTTSSLVYPYAGIWEYVLSAGSGRFSSLSGTRYGLFFDTFQLFQSFLNTSFFSMVTSGTSCPSSSTYTYLVIRWRSPDSPRYAMDATSTLTRVGGTLSYTAGTSPAFSSTNSFDLVGPNVYGTSYTLDNTGYGNCSSGQIKLANNGGPALDPYGLVYFGNTFAMYAGSGGNPMLATLMPQQTLTSGIMSALGNQVLSGLFTGFTSKTTQTQQNVYVVPNTAGTTFTLNTVNNFSDPTNSTFYGTITCTTLNSPATGFCKGTLTLSGVAGTSNAICQLGNTSTQDLLACTFSEPNKPQSGGSLIATRSTTSLLSLTTPTSATSVAPGGTTTVVATLQNLTGTYIPTMADPSSVPLQLSAPFSDPSAYTGSGGTCGASLKGFATCNVNLTYNPTVVGTTQEVFRTAYNNQSSTVNATSNVVGVSGLVSLAISPNSSYFSLGSTQQFTATATYTGGSTQDVTSAVAWSGNNATVASMSTSGSAQFLSTGTVTFTAALAGVSTTISPTVYIPSPNPTGLIATPSSYTQINLSWTSGGGSTTAFQIAYQTGFTAPADCNSNTVISSGVVGNVTSYAVTGLIPGTAYAFRVCSVNGTAGAISSGATVGGTTNTPHSIFSTAGTFNGAFGGVNFADFICQTEASNASLGGIWKAVLSDSSNSALSRIALSQSIYNLRPAASGNVQLVSTQANFWNTGSVNYLASINYTASGGSPGSGSVWTGSLATGASNGTRQCSNWTTGSSGTTGESGNDAAVNSTTQVNANSTCNNLYGLYCINLQTSSLAPPDPTGFTLSIQSSTYVQYSWASGGGTTAGYKLAYQTGATAPANCSSGTVISATTLGYNPTSYAVTGLTSNTQYSFRLCAVNSDQSLASTGVTNTVTTTSSGTITNLGTRQIVFNTSSTRNASFGGIYFADYICQTEANNAGLVGGVWKALISDESTNATLHTSITPPVYNNRPVASGGYVQIAADSASFWGSSIAATTNYNAGGTAPGSNNSWTGSNANGTLYAGRTCTSWTTASSGQSGEYGSSNLTGNIFSNGTNTCNSNLSLACINQQSPSATPFDPTGFFAPVTGTTTVQFSWASGGGTTAAYQMSYVTGASVPANCNTGTIISSATLGVNPTSYTVTGLTANTQYSFRLCAVNSDSSAMSTGVTLTQTTTSSGTITNLGTQQVVFSTAGTQNGAFGGLYFGDYICQQEAINNGLVGGIWKAILADDSNSAIGRINIPGNVYNNRPSGSGGYQLLAANSASFWSSSFPSSMYYNAAGGTPGTNIIWTGSTGAGAIVPSTTCSSWTTASVGNNGEYGNTNTTGNLIGVGNTTCNTARSLLCTNQQTAAAAPPDATGFYNPVTSSTSIQFAWASGGGTTAAFQMSYQTGATAPADCNSGTLISAPTLGVNPTSYTVTGLAASTQYSFRLCAANSDLSLASTGVTTTVTTTATGSITNLGSRQVVFATNTRYAATFGGLYFADYICQTEATNASISGTWKAILSDDSTSAFSRITIPGSVYNNRPSGSGGYQLEAANSASFWSSAFPSTFYYNASGNTPGTNVAWTGSTGAGASVVGSTCASWTTASSGNVGEYGNVNTTGNLIGSGTTACNNTYTLYCTNQQTSASTPPDATSFLNATTSANSIQFSWLSGGGTTAAYQMAYTTGATAPVDCNSNTVISAATLGINPTGYTVTGLAASTQYSFRLCAENSDLTLASAGVTLTVTTTASGTLTNLGTRQVVFVTDATYLGNFGGLYYADWACQMEANTFGLTGIWKSIISDDTTTALSRISIPGSVYNNRPAASGGYQLVAANSASFWSNAFPFTMNYDTAGSTPGSVTTWTGSTTAGAINTGFTCSSWSTASPSSRGEYGGSSGTGNEIANGNNPCNNQYALYCTNQQSAALVPPDPTTFATYSVGPTSIGFDWTSGGGTTAAYQISYQTGATAPVDCNSGSVILAGTLGVNPTTYTITSLIASTQYSFRLCAFNSDLSLASTGKTLTVTTGAAATNPSVNYGTTQVIFQTNNIYNANFGGLYFGDYICQKEAVNAGLTGTWKAVLSDDSTSASSRISISGNVYNNRPLSSGGIQRLATSSATFFNFIFPYSLRYSAAGATPTNIYAWTGSLTTGALNLGNTCSSWTTNINTSNAAYGVTSNTFSTSVFDNATTPCNNNVLGLYCINQQTSAAAPPDATTFTSPTVTTSSISLAWTSGGLTTAAFQISYQSGATAPSTCNTGTIISTTTLGINPSSYVVTGLSSGTQYSFRLCALNSDSTQITSGLTLSATTTATITPANQTLFGTTGTYYPTFGGAYFGDFICQTEATNGGLAGVWKAVLSDSTSNANVKITRSATIWNNRPAGSGGPQQITTSASFWSGAGWTASPNYSASGGAPGTNITWTGSSAAGVVASTCSNWTSDLASALGTYGNGNANTSAGVFTTGTTNCNSARALYCINQQTAAATPPDPTSFSVYETGANSVGFNWTSGGLTTAAYILTYQAGATAPANCSSGTIVSATTLGVNPSTYTIQGLSASTQYSFRLCATNSDQSATSAGLTVTATTPSSGNTFTLGSTQYIFATTGLYRGNLGGINFADYVCQNEAANAGMGGIWKAVLSDTTNAASGGRISLSGNIYNLRGPSLGGAQRVSDATNFWNNLMYNAVNYTATGTTPSTTISWTGSTSTGTSAATNCTNWTTVANTISGEYGTNSSTNSAFASGTSTCNNAWTLYCINQQTAALAPSNPATFVSYSSGSTSIGLAWTSGGGTTAAYQLAYQTGATAPASCSAGTVIAPSTLGYNPTTFTVTGLSSSTQYSFRLCAYNSDLSLASSGLTVTATTVGAAANQTTTPGNLQLMYSTAATYFGNFGGIYFGDFACQLEANNAGVAGIWKSVTGDESTAGSTHISLSSAIYNMRPNSAGGIQQVSNGTGFWSGPLLQNLNYSVNGGAPGSVRNWVGAMTTGAINTGLTCSSWTTQINTSSASAGYSTTPGNGMNNANNTCNTLNSLSCINQQTASIAPPDPATFTNYFTGPNSIGFAWTTGGGTTAAYQLAYQTGATAPANCASGTVIPASTLGVNPSSYSLSSLSPSTQYSFRLCAYNSDLSASSAGITLTLTTLANGTPLSYTNNVQEIFSLTAAYYGNFGGVYYADYACQQEAITAGYLGVWKALIADDTITATSRISLGTAIYNARPPTSGGIQQISNGTGFWGGPWNYPTNYTASGGTPTTVRNWTGTTALGGSNTGVTCNSWATEAAASNGEVGYSTSQNNGLVLGTNTCNSQNGFLCINQQTASTTPPNPSAFNIYSVSANEIGLAWTSGGGTTGAYQIAYQTGATAPANCTTGTIVTATQLGMNPSTYALTGLSSTTQYSVRLCAANSDASSFSSGLTVTTTTQAPASSTTYSLGTTQVIFSTANLYEGNFGGIYFGDFACQIEANNAGMTGTWRSITGDEATAASAHVSLSTAIYNNRPQTSGGLQKISNGTGFWPGAWAQNANYTAAGGAPGSVRNWSGNTNTGGINTGNTCSSWTSAVSTANGLAAYSTTPQNGMFNAYNNCTTYNSLYCINQQSSAATPSNPGSFTAYATGTNSIGFIWTSGGGTTAAYQLAYQSGATAPASCSVGTIISATTLGVNPSTYTVTGLSSSTQYSFRLCAENSDLTAASSGLTLTVTTTASGTNYSLGSNQFIFGTQGNYLGNFGGIYFADYICQAEANTAGVPGTWRAIISDLSNTASSHVSLSGNLFNFRPSAAGGSQFVTTGNSFFNAGTLYNTFPYTASGTTPGNVQGWDGSTTAGGTFASYHCNSWTTSANTVNGMQGRNNQTTNFVQNGGVTCNASRGLMCVNQQASAAAPSTPTGLNVYEIGSTYIGLNWASGGGTTATYQIAYQSGGTAPSTCALGTIVNGTNMGVNPTIYAITGLNPSTQYSFRLCAANSDSTAFSTGVTISATTLASGQTFTPGTNQFAFSTAAAYSPNFGGLYFGDFICQNEATTAGLGGTWKAVLGDDTTAATSHVSVSGNIYNMNLGTSNGSQFAINGTDFWTGVLTNLIKYTAAGGTPAKVNQWTGATTAGALNTNHTCSNWTNNTGAFNAGYGVNTSSTNYVYNGTIACNNTEALLCLNQQTASGTPPNPATFTVGTKTTSSIQVNWTGGGGTTAAYQLSYQLGATAPANCSSGTVVPASTLGINPVTTTVTGLTTGTQYSFRLCAENSSLSAASSGLTLSATTN